MAYLAGMFCLASHANINEFKVKNIQNYHMFPHKVLKSQLWLNRTVAITSVPLQFQLFLVFPERNGCIVWANANNRKMWVLSDPRQEKVVVKLTSMRFWHGYWTVLEPNMMSYENKTISLSLVHLIDKWTYCVDIFIISRLLAIGYPWEQCLLCSTSLSVASGCICTLWESTWTAIDNWQIFFLFSVMAMTSCCWRYSLLLF